MSKMYFFSISKSQISSRLKIWVISLHRLPWTNSSWYGIGQQAMLWKIKQVKYGTTWLVKLRPRYNWKLRDFTLHTRHYLAHNFSFGFWYQMPKTRTRRTRRTKTMTRTRTSGFPPQMLQCYFARLNTMHVYSAPVPQCTCWSVGLAAWFLLVVWWTWCLW